MASAEWYIVQSDCNQFTFLMQGNNREINGKKDKNNKTNLRNHHQESSYKTLGITTLGVVCHHYQTKKRDVSQIIKIVINHQVS